MKFWCPIGGNDSRMHLVHLKSHFTNLCSPALRCICATVNLNASANVGMVIMLCIISLLRDLGSWGEHRTWCWGVRKRLERGKSIWADPRVLIRWCTRRYICSSSCFRTEWSMLPAFFYTAGKEPSTNQQVAWVAIAGNFTPMVTIQPMKKLVASTSQNNTGSKRLLCTYVIVRYVERLSKIPNVCNGTDRPPAICCLTFIEHIVHKIPWHCHGKFSEVYWTRNQHSGLNSSFLAWLTHYD